MDAMKLLSSLLSGKSLSSTLGSQLLGGIFGGGSKKAESSGGASGLLGGLFKKFTGGMGGAAPAALTSPAAATEEPEHDQQSANDQAVLLIRAMVCAAKSDGRVDQDEQDKIIGKLGDDVTQAEIDFLKREFASNISVNDFAKSVPVGMEQQVYAVSLTAIDLDTQNEAKYLHELAQGLNLGAETCNEIHEQCGAPKIYSR